FAIFPSGKTKARSALRQPRLHGHALSGSFVPDLSGSQPRRNLVRRLAQPGRHFFLAHLIDDEADIGRRDRRNELLIARTDDGARDVPNALHDTARLENEAISPNLFALSLQSGQIQVSGAALQ